MPLQTVFDRLVAGGDVAGAARRIGVLAWIADMAAAAAMWWGWGRRQSATYLVCGLPLLSFLYLRFDLIAVALAVWAYAFLRRRHPELSGGALGLAVMAKLWPIALAPVFALRKERRGLVVAAIVCVLVGAWWFMTGGPKGPFQVLSIRGARGWHIESVFGSVLWAFGRGSPYREADALRIGDVSFLARVAVGIALVATEGWIWRRASLDRRDPMGAATLASVAALAVFSPVFSLQVAIWLLPFAALAFEGEHDERHTAGVAMVAVVLTGLIALAWRDHGVTPSGWIAWLVVARNLVWIDIVISWLRVPVLRPEARSDTAPPRRRATDTATEGIEAVLPFEAD
jgi:hypothetical protein